MYIIQTKFLRHPIIKHFDANEKDQRTYLFKVVRHVPLEFDGPVPGALLALPPPLGGHYAHALLVAGAEHALGLPPLVVAGVRDVQDVAVVEGEPPRRQSVVLHRVVVEERPETVTFTLGWRFRKIKLMNGWP